MDAFGACFPNMLWAFGEHELEIFDEAGSERVVLLEILFAAGPGVYRVEDLRRDALTLRGHVEAKHGVFFVGDIQKRTAEGGVKKGARVLDVEIWNLLESRGISHVMLIGVHRSRIHNTGERLRNNCHTLRRLALE